MADTGVKKEHAALEEVPYDDDEVALVGAATEPAVDDDDPAGEVDMLLTTGSGGKSEAQMNGAMVLSLLDKIIGVGRPDPTHPEWARGPAGGYGEEKVRKVSVNVKTVRSNLEKQAGQIKKLESNENELLKRRNFKVLIYQDQVKPPKTSKTETVAEGKAVEGLEQIPEEGREGLPDNLNSDEEVEIEEIIEESRTKRLQRSTKQQVDNIKKAFSKEKMEKTKLKTKENLEKTKQRTRENLEKTRQKTRDNLEKTKHSLEKKIGKLGTRMTPNQERRMKMKTSKDKVYARSKTTVYRVPPFTFHVKKIREGEEEVVQNTELEDVTEAEGQPGGEENGLGMHEEVEVEEGELVSVDSPLLEVTEDSQLVSVEPDYLKKAQSE
ncbi:Caveolae-associated protein 1 [Larimichthys crocea]|uniref:Uncharacterized protein n=1 Tax=Larimichthys crocea TaxID=215358 RepID=A0ACD3R8B1_LARCR|nr:Caveolae-associated protein 1 [Larimichthys crocea]